MNAQHIKHSPLRRFHRLLIVALVPMIHGCGSPSQPSPPERSRTSVVREQSGAARVEGVGPIVGFAKGRDCTFLHCLELVLESVGRRLGYDELMGISGLAFRTQFRVDQWDVGNADPLVGDSRLEVLSAAIGWKCELRIVRRDELAETDSLYRAIRQSIDAGVPVPAANVIPPEDWGIITGYRRDQNLLCRSYNGQAQVEDQPATGWPTAVVILSDRQPVPDLRKTHQESIRRAVELFEKRASGSYAQGRKAFDEWCQSLRTASERRYVHANFWTYICLIDARGAAVRYLKSIAPEFGSKQIHIQTAADLYDMEVRLLIRGLEFVPPEHKYPDSLPPREMRNRQIEALQEARDLESRAIDSLKKAL